MVWYMSVICSSQSQTCPIGQVANVLPDHWSIGGTRPALSPAAWRTPVRCPRPNFRTDLEEALRPSRWASIKVPTLEDLPKIPVVV